MAKGPGKDERVIRLVQRARTQSPTLLRPPPSFVKIRLRGQKSSICEEYPEAYLFLIILTWENAGRSVSKQPFSSAKAHMSTNYVHRTLFFEKKGGGEDGSGEIANCVPICGASRVRQSPPPVSPSFFLDVRRFCSNLTAHCRRVKGIFSIAPGRRGADYPDLFVFGYLS